MLKQRETKRNRQTSIMRYVFDQPREQWFSDAVECVYGIKAERREENVKEKKKEADGGRERWEEWRSICGSHGPEKELLVLTRLNVCLWDLCVSLESPRALRPKGSHRHLLSPRNMTHLHRERQEKKKELGRGAFVCLCLHYRDCLCVCVLDTTKTETVL